MKDDAVVYVSAGHGSHWHLTPLCWRLMELQDWGTVPFDLVWESGLRCCAHCAEGGYHGQLNGMIAWETGESEG